MKTKHGLTNSLYSYVFDKNEWHMGALIKRGGIIFSLSFKRNPYWYHSSILANQTPSNSDKVTFTTSVKF